MPKISQLQRVKEIAFNWPGSDETLNLMVYPDRMSGRALENMSRQLKATSDDDDIAQHKFLCAFMSALVESWDLTFEDGTAIPTTEEAIFENVPVTLVAALLKEIEKSLEVNPRKPEP